MNLITLINACGLIVSPTLVGGIVDVESKAKPYSINVNSKSMKVKSHSFDTKLEAIEYTKKLLPLLKGKDSVDMGLGQINSINLPSLGLSVNEVFDPCTNLTALQSVFLRGYNLKVDKDLNQEQKEIAALSRYNTGHPRWGISNGYVNKVLTAKMKIEGVNNPALALAKRPTITIKHSLPAAIPREGIPDGFSKAIPAGHRSKKLNKPTE